MYLKSFIYNKKVIFSLAGLLFIIAVILISIGCQDSCSLTRSIKANINSQESAKSLPQVKVLDLSDSNNKNLFITFIGTIKPEAEVQVVSLVSGQVVSLNKKVGQEVLVNEILAILDSPELETNLSLAKTNLFNAQESLAQTKLSTQTQVNQAELAVKNAELSLELARKSLTNVLQSNQEDLQSAEKNLESAELSLEQAQDNLNNFIVQAEQSKNSLVSQAEVIYSNQLVFLENARKNIDDLLKFKDSLGSLNFQVKSDSMPQAEFLKDQIIDF